MYFELKTNEEIVAYDYQISMLELAKSRNLVAVLGTGSGKTYIAVMTIRYFLFETTEPWGSSNAKRTFFLATSVPLVIQQHAYLSRHLPVNVKLYIGDMGVDIWTQEQWVKEFDDARVLVMTPAILHNLLSFQYITIGQINLIVIDECHHASGNHPYGKIMRSYHNEKARLNLKPREDLPKILGLTASVTSFKCKLNQLESRVRLLAENLDSHLEFGLNLRPNSIRIEHIVYDNETFGEERLFLDKSFEIMKNVEDRCDEIKNELKQQKRNMFCEIEANLKANVPVLTDHMGIIYTEYKQNFDLSRVDKVAKLMRGVIDSISEYGMLIGHYLFERIMEFASKNSPNAPLPEIEQLHLMFRECCKSRPSDESSLFKLTTPKFKKIVDVLRSHHQTNINLHAMIFVDTRASAYGLTSMLQCLAELSEEFRWIKPMHLVQSGADLWSNANTCKAQIEHLKSFRENISNVMVATSIAHEGIDVPSCNLIIMTYFTNNFVFYQQAKGRARQSRALFAIMSKKYDAYMCQKTLREFELIEKHIESRNSLLVDTSTLEFNGLHSEDLMLQMTTEELKELRQIGLADHKSLSILTVVGNVHIDPAKCITILYKYAIGISMTTSGVALPVMLINDEGDGQFRCAILMPHNCHMKQWVTIGPRSRSKRVAKLAACVQLCQALYKEGELTDELLPKVYLEKKSMYRRSQEMEKFKDGGFRFVQRPLSHLFKCDDDSHLNIYSLEKNGSLLSVGIATYEELDNGVSVRIKDLSSNSFFPVKLRRIVNLYRDANINDKLCAFTNHIIAITFQNQSLWEGTIGIPAFYVVPINNDSMDIKILEYFSVTRLSEQLSKWNVGQVKELGLRSCVCTNYKNDRVEKIMYVAAIDDKKNINSTIGGKVNSTMVEYFKRR
ncbi:hypothetical protein ACOME3_007181 [Neoechinorhynchus agilis]